MKILRPYTNIEVARMLAKMSYITDLQSSEPYNFKAKAYLDAAEYIIELDILLYSLIGKGIKVPKIGPTILNMLIDLYTGRNLSILVELNNVNTDEYEIGYLIEKEYVKTLIEFLKISISKHCGMFDVSGDIRLGRNYVQKIVLITVPKSKIDFYKELEKFGDKTIISKPNYYRILFKKNIDINIDIVIVKKEIFGPSMLYETGNQVFYINMKIAAKEAGFTLRKDGLFINKTELVSCETEKDVFDKIGVEYIEPCDRTWKEIKNV